MPHPSHRQDLGLLDLQDWFGEHPRRSRHAEAVWLVRGHGLSGTAGGVEAMGFHPPKISAVMAGLGEAGGGALLTLGLATPVAGAATASTMLAAGAVHKPAGFFATEGGFEYSAVLGLAGAAIAISGPGHYSLDRLLDNRLNRPWMAAVALTVLGSASAAIIARGRTALDSETPTATEQIAEGEQAEPTGASASSPLVGRVGRDWAVSLQ